MVAVESWVENWKHFVRTRKMCNIVVINKKKNLNQGFS